MAVFYDDNFYVGTVVNIIDEDNTAVQFFQSNRLKANHFCINDNKPETINNIFILKNNVDLQTSNGRTWKLSDEDLFVISDMYTRRKLNWQKLGLF